MATLNSFISPVIKTGIFIVLAAKTPMAISQSSSAELGPWQQVASLHHDSVPVDELPSSIAIHWGNPEGQKLVVITRLSCPWCKAQQSELEKLKDVHIEEYLLPDIDEKGDIDKKSAAIWCNTDRLQTLNKAFNYEAIPVFDHCDANSLWSVIDVVQRYSLWTTPILIKESGKYTIGFKNVKNIQKWLEEK